MSIYTLDMSGTEITNDDYVRIMGGFQEQMKSLSSRSALRDAAWNAMAWSTYSFADNSAGMTFYSSAFAPIFFDNDFPNAVITTATAGICLWPWQYGTYNNAENVLTFNVREKFGPNIDPYKYGYFLGSNTSSIWDHGTFFAISIIDCVYFSFNVIEACDCEPPLLRLDVVVCIPPLIFLGHLLDACPAQLPLHTLYNSAVTTCKYPSFIYFIFITSSSFDYPTRNVIARLIYIIRVSNMTYPNHCCCYCRCPCRC